MLKFVLVASLVGTWAAPVKDALISRQDGSSLEDDILGLSNLDEDSKLWTAFYCEGANYGGQCISQQYSNGECTPIEPPLCENVLSFLATSSNCVLYEGDDCTGSAVPIYSSAQDLHAFRKTNSYRCGLSSAQVAAQLATPLTTPGAHSPAPAPLVSLTSTESATIDLVHSAKETSIVDVRSSAVTSAVEVFPAVSQSTTSRTDDTPPAATADATASSVPILTSLFDDPHRHHRHPKYVTVTETATRVVDAYVAPTETLSPSSVTNNSSPAESREVAPSSTRTTNTEGAATSTPSHHRHRLPKYVTVTETATRTVDPYVTPSTTLSEQTVDKVLAAPGILTTSTQRLPASGASDTSQVVGKPSLSIASSPTSLVPSVHDVVDAAVATAPPPNPSLSAPSASIISPTETISHTVVSSESSTSETSSSTSDSVKYVSTGLPSKSEGTDVASGHQTKSLIKGGSATTGVPAPTQLHDNGPSEASPALPVPIPSASTTPITVKQSAALLSVEHASTGVSSLAGTPTASVLAGPEGHSETISNVTPVKTPSSLPSPTPEATERPPSSRPPTDHVAYPVTHETLLTSATLSPTSVSANVHTTSTATAQATTLVESLVSTPAFSVNVAPSAPASTSTTPASTEAPIIPPAVNTGTSTAYTVAATDQVTKDVKTTVTHQIAIPTVTSISTASTGKNEGPGGSHEDGPSHLPVDSSAAIPDVLPTSSSGIPPKESASASTTAFSSSLQAPSLISSPTQISHAAEDASRTNHGTVSSVLATHSFSSTQAPEGEVFATATTHGVTTLDAPSFTLSSQPSTTTVSHPASPATGPSAVAAQIPSPHTSSTLLTDLGAATPPPRSLEDEVLATVTVHQVTSLGTASTHVPTSISVASTSSTLPLVKDEGSNTVTAGASSTLSAPSSIGSPRVIETTHVTYDAPSAAPSLLSIPAVASHTDHGRVASATVDQNIGGYSLLAAQSSSAVSTLTFVVHTPSETHPSASHTYEPASPPAEAIQPEGETASATVRQTTLPGPTGSSTTLNPVSSVISTSRVLPVVTPFESSSTLANGRGGLTSTSPFDKEAITTTHPTPTSTDRAASRPPSSMSSPSEVHASDKGLGIHEPTSFGSAETLPGSVQATPASVLHTTSHQGLATGDEGTAYVTVTPSTLITPTAAAQTTVPGSSSEALATAKYPHVTNGVADVTSAPISPVQTTSITAPPDPSASNALVYPSPRVSEGYIQPSEATDSARSTTPLSPVDTPVSSSISTGTPTAGSISSEKILISHPTISQAPSEVVRPNQETTRYGGTTGLPTSVHEPATTTTSYTGAALLPVTPANPASLLPTHAVKNDDDLVYVTVHRTAGSVPTTTPVGVASPKVKDSGEIFAAGVTSASSSIASTTHSGAPGEGPVYATSRTTDGASDTPTSVPKASTVLLPSTTAVSATSNTPTPQDGIAYTTIQQSVTVGVTSTTTYGTLASVSSPSQVVDDESLAYVTIHRTRTIGAPLTQLSASVASVSSGAELPTITHVLASSAVPPAPSAEKESLVYVTDHTPVTTRHSAVVSHTVDEGVYATAESTKTAGPSSTAHVTVTPSIGAPTGVEAEAPANVTVQQLSTGSNIVTNVAENTGDANDVPVLPTSTPSISTLPYVSAGTGSGAPMTEKVKITVTSVGTTPAASATFISRILSTKKERFTTIRYTGTRTSTPTTTAPRESTSVATAAPVERTGTKTTVNTGDLDDIPVLQTFTSAIPTLPYASSSATVTGTIEQVKSAVVEPAASFGTTITAANVTTSTKPATSDRTFVSSALPGGASMFTSTIIVIPASRSTGVKTIVVGTTGDSDDIPVLPATPTPLLANTKASLGTSSLLQATSVPSPSPTLATTGRSELPPPVETASSVPISTVPATVTPSPTPGATTVAVSPLPETLSIPNAPATDSSTTSSQYTSSTVVSPSYSQRTPESASALSSSPITATIIDTQIPTASSGLQATYTSTPTLLPVTNTNQSQGTPSLLPKSSSPSSSLTLATVEHSNTVETVSILSVSVSSVPAFATPVPFSGAATVAVSTLLETVSVPISSPAAVSAKSSHSAASAAASPPYSPPLASSATARVISPTSSTPETVSTPSSSPMTAAVKDTPPSITETATLSVQSTSLVQGSIAPTTSSPAAATRKEFPAAPIPTSSPVTTIAEDKQNATSGNVPAPSVSFTTSGEGAHPSSSAPEVQAAPSSSPSIVVIKDSPLSSPVKISHVIHPPTPIPSSAYVSSDSQSGSSFRAAVPPPISLPVVTSAKQDSVHPTPVELVTATPAAATPVSASLESTSSPTPAPAASSFKDRLVSPVSTHASAATGASVKDTNSPIEPGAHSTPTALTTTPSPSITTHSNATPTPKRTHHHNHHGGEEEEIVYVTIVTTTTVTEPVCTTTTYPTETVTQTIVEVAQPTGLPNGQ